MTTPLKATLISKCHLLRSEVRTKRIEPSLKGKGIRIAAAVIETIEDDARYQLSYLAVLAKALDEAKSKIRGTADDDKDGLVLGGIQTVINLVQAEARTLDSQSGRYRLFK